MHYSHIFGLIVLWIGTETIHGYQVKDAPLLTKRPSWLKVCKRSDPNLNKCLNDLFIEMFPQLATGIPEMNVDRFEPLLLDKVSVSKGAGPITLSGSLYNLIISGPSNSTPTYTEVDIPKRKWNFGIEIPLLSIKSQYNLKGQILVLPLIGHGNCDLRLGKVKTKVTTNTSFPIRDGHEIMKIQSMHVSFSVGALRVKFHNLFNGNKILGQTVNSFINQNGLDIIDDLEESIGDSLSQIFTDIINNIFTKLPTNLWLLTDEQYETYQTEESEKNSK